MLGRPAKIKLIRDTMILSSPYDKDELWQADESLYRATLSLKLFEEAAEVAANPSDVDEYADLLDVLVTLASANGIRWDNVVSAMIAKRERRGGFAKGRVGLHTYPDKENSDDRFDERPVEDVRGQGDGTPFPAVDPGRCPNRR